MRNQSEKIIELIKEALGEHEKYFNIFFDGFLVEDDDLQSMTIGFEPKQVLEITADDCKVVGEKQYIQFDAEWIVNSDYEYNLIVGEDTQMDITFGNIYSVLYWCEVVKNN